MTIVGLDLSLAATGVAILDHDGSIETSTIATKPAAGVRDTASRLLRIVHDIETTIEAAYANLIVIEGLAIGSRTGSALDRAGLWWLTVTTLVHHYDLAVAPPTSRAKYATGKGNAGKDTVLIEFTRRFPNVMCANNNEVDAAILACMGADHRGQPVVRLPETHRAALNGVTWPEMEVAP